MTQDRKDRDTRVKFCCPFCEVRVSNTGASKHREKWHPEVGERAFLDALVVRLKSGAQQFELSGKSDQAVNPTSILMAATKPKTKDHIRLVRGGSPGLKRKST
jgi:hypothetical protein